MAESEQTFEVRPIKPGDRLTGLSLGDAKFVALKTFLQKHAADFQAKSLARTYAAFTQEKVIGYITLVCGEVTIEAGEQALVDDVEYRYLHYPAVKIARLATHKDFRKNGVAKVLVELSLGIAKETISQAVGCRFVVVDSKKDAVQFYIKRGFTLLDTTANRERSEQVMFLDLHKVI